MKKVNIFLLVVVFISIFFEGAQAENAGWSPSSPSLFTLPPDSVVLIKGTIINANDSTPVVAHIRYKKLPYGDDVGIFVSRQNGNYEMPVVNLSSYIFEAKAEGYYPLRQQVDINDFNNDKLILKNFVLQPLRIGQIMDFDNFLFEQSEAILLSESYPVLDKLVDLLVANPDMVIQLEGHTDFKGSSRANRKLADRRVKVIRDYLINKGIERKRVKTKAFGGTKPLSTEGTPGASKINRRVEIRILEE